MEYKYLSTELEAMTFEYFWRDGRRWNRDWTNKDKFSSCIDVSSIHFVRLSFGASVENVYVRTVRVLETLDKQEERRRKG